MQIMMMVFEARREKLFMNKQERHFSAAAASLRKSFYKA